MSNFTPVIHSVLNFHKRNLSSVRGSMRGRQLTHDEKLGIAFGVANYTRDAAASLNNEQLRQLAEAGISF